MLKPDLELKHWMLGAGARARNLSSGSAIAV